MTFAFVDTHAHLDDEQFAQDLPDLLQRAHLAGVRKIVNIGYRPARWRTTRELAERYPAVLCAFGLHPHHCEEWSPEVRQELLALLETNRPVALGEIGLDLFRNLNPIERQIDVFEEQLRIAKEARLPVIIHQRGAEAELMRVLARTPPELVCVLHSYDGSSELAHFAIQRGYYFGAGGLMTRGGSIEVRAVLKSVALDRLLLETDAPYLVPTGVKNRKNEPANLPVIARFLADLRETSVEEIAFATTRNAERLFRSALSATTLEVEAV
jgi:TatD DNase family protein